jgi:thiol-disulfide isomerase/thioredoxin
MFDSSRDPVFEEPKRSRLAGGFYTILLAVPVIVVLALVITGILSETILPEGPPRGGLEVGKPAPSVVAEGWLNEESPSPGDYRGKITVLVAWATWCEPCRRETPELVELHHKYHDKGVVFVGLTREGPEAIGQMERFIERFKIPWLIGYSADRTLDEFKSNPIPAAWIIDSKGKVIWNIDSKETLAEGIEQAVKAHGSK